MLPFRSCLLKVEKHSISSEIRLSGIDYEVIKENGDITFHAKLLAFPGQKKNIKLLGDYGKFSMATINGKVVNDLLKGKEIEITFPGEPYKEKYHRRIAIMEKCPVPSDAISLYEATCFAADNNALEVRSLDRSGATSIPEVKIAREAFFKQETFIERNLWDKYLFDDNGNTAFGINLRWSLPDIHNNDFRLDMGKTIKLDSIVITVPDRYSLQPLKTEEGHIAQVSPDLVNWQDITFITGEKMVINLAQAPDIRYLKFNSCPLKINEIQGYFEGKSIDRTNWKASYLCKSYNKGHWDKTKNFNAKHAWKHSFQLNEIQKNSYLCIAVKGKHGEEGAFAAVKIDGKYYGCPDRSPSYQSNTWEAGVRKTGENYTYYFPLKKEYTGKQIEVFVLEFFEEENLKPEVYLTAYPIPHEEKTLTLE